MKRAHLVALVTTLSLGSVGVVVAAPRPKPPVAPFVAEVIYPYKTSNYDDLRLSNAAGTAAVLLHRGTSISAYDLAPPSRQMAAFVDTDASFNKHLQVRSWTVNAATGAITVGAPRPLDSARSMFLADFSPTGDRIAYASSPGGGLYEIKIVDVATGSIITIAGGVSPSTLRWSKNGDWLYYVERDSAESMAAYRQPVSGGQREVMFREANIEPWDISRGATDGLIFPYSRIGWNYVALGQWDGANVTSVPSFSNVSRPHYSCGNDRLIYRSSANGNPGPVKIYNFAAQTSVTFSRDQNIIHADFMPCD